MYTNGSESAYLTQVTTLLFHLKILTQCPRELITIFKFSYDCNQTQSREGVIYQCHLAGCNK